MAQWDMFAQGQVPKLYSKGQLIYMQGEIPRFFYYLVSGSVRSFLSSPDGDERILTIHRSGDLMGEASFFDQYPRVSSAMALEDSLVVSIDQQRLDQIFMEHPQLAQPLLRYLARTVRLLSDHVDTASLPAIGRVARHLLTLPRGKDNTVVCTHESIGQAIGMSRITVSRAMKQLGQRGSIETGYGVVRILDEGLLQVLQNR